MKHHRNRSSRIVALAALIVVAVSLLHSFAFDWYYISSHRTLQGTITASTSSMAAAVIPGKGQNRSGHYAVVHFVDAHDGYLWGVFSVHQQMRKFGMLDGKEDISHVVILADMVTDRKRELLEDWVGKENVRMVDVNHIRKKVNKGVWPHVFSKMEAFNLVDFDKVIFLDCDILIRTNLAHWFDYPTPAATVAGATIEWNSGAMVLTPSTKLYEQLLQYLAKSTTWDAKKKDSNDTWNSGFGQQGMLSAFFTSNITEERMFTMPYGASVLSSAVKREPSLKYFARHRTASIETVHFTVDKPWKTRTKTSDPDVCRFLLEWNRSVAEAVSIPGMPPLTHDYMAECPKEIVAAALEPADNGRPKPESSTMDQQQEEKD